MGKVIEIPPRSAGRTKGIKEEVFETDGYTKTCRHCGVRQIPVQPLCRVGRPETWEVHMVYLDPVKEWREK